MNFSIELSKTARDDLDFWKTSGKQKILNRIVKLLKELEQNPFEGTGKPEPLKHELSGYWSRRISREHRLVYTVKEETVYIIALRYHYS
jgi:toxin YoeB